MPRMAAICKEHSPVSWNSARVASRQERNDNELNTGGHNFIQLPLEFVLHIKTIIEQGNAQDGGKLVA